MTSYFFPQIRAIGIYQMSKVKKKHLKKQGKSLICGFFQHFLSLFETFTTWYSHLDIKFEFSDQFQYSKVANSSMSWLVAHFQIFRMLMKRKLNAYVLWPLTKKFQNWIVNRLLLATLRYMKHFISKTFLKMN